MLFWLKKVVGFWLMPLPLSLVLIVAGACLLGFTRRQKTGRALALAGLAWLIVCSNAGVGTWLVRGLESRYPAQPVFSATTPPPAPLARCAYVAVLGGGHSLTAGWPANQQLSDSALARIVEGVRIARQLPGARLIVSGPPDSPDGGRSHASLLSEVAVSLGVPAERIIEIDTARDTEAEAAAIASITHGTPVALVSSAWHMPRALALCQRQGIDVLACPADYEGRPPELRWSDFAAWNIGGLERSTKAIYERIGATWSHLRGKT